MGVNFVTSANIEMKYAPSISAKGGFTFGVFRELIRDLAIQFRRQEGRYYSLLTLQEAEHFRGILHARDQQPLLASEFSFFSSNQPYTSSALWLMGELDVTLLGNSLGFQQNTAAAQHGAMVNSYRFLNSESYYDDRGISILLRVLESNTCESREKWWFDIRACRRRRQISLDQSIPITTVFTLASEYEFLEFKSVVERIKYALNERGLLVYDAFRAFNSSNSGLLSCSEVNGAMHYLDIPFTPEQVYDLVRRLAIQNDVSSKAICLPSYP